MLKINEAIIVEGKYDKIKLQNVVDALIIETDGFGIFKDKEKQKEICRILRKKVREIDTRYRCMIVTETSYIEESK